MISWLTIYTNWIQIKFHIIYSLVQSCPAWKQELKEYKTRSRSKKKDRKKRDWLGKVLNQKKIRKSKSQSITKRSKSKSLSQFPRQINRKSLKWFESKKKSQSLRTKRPIKMKRLKKRFSSLSQDWEEEEAKMKNKGPKTTVSLLKSSASLPKNNKMRKLKKRRKRRFPNRR